MRLLSVGDTMTGGRFWLLFAWAWAAGTFAFSTWLIVIIGAPPRHCRYLVPIENKPGIYACSEHAKARTKP